KLHIPVGHVEAGLRSYDKTMPEEINREVADVCSKIFFVPTEESAVNLILEGIHPKDIFITGNTIVDACMRHLEIAKKKANLPFKMNENDKILTLTMHRAENVDNHSRFKSIVEALLELKEVIIVFPAHPRTIKNLKKQDLLEKMDDADHIKLIKPVGYLDFLLLLSKSEIIMTDSGGLQEEAITLNIPCTTLRYNTERPETVEAGGNILVGAKKKKIVDTVREILNDTQMYSKMSKARNPYGEGNSSIKIMDAILKQNAHDELKMRVPEDIMKIRSRKIIEINEDITVSEFEKKNGFIEIRMVFENGKLLFPYDNLNLKNKLVLLEELT
ncbi:MAG: non-hydrolyzing UDP-N-acetylglucosamine 2-epimerase, partial [Methanobacterium sp.]